MHKSQFKCKFKVWWYRSRERTFSADNLFLWLTGDYSPIFSRKRSSWGKNISGKHPLSPFILLGLKFHLFYCLNFYFSKYGTIGIWWSVVLVSAVTRVLECIENLCVCACVWYVFNVMEQNQRLPEWVCKLLRLCSRHLVPGSPSLGPRSLSCQDFEDMQVFLLLFFCILHPQERGWAAERDLSHDSQNHLLELSFNSLFRFLSMTHSSEPYAIKPSRLESLLNKK